MPARARTTEVNSILEQLQSLTDADLYALCELVETELHHRGDADEEFPDSARRRAVERDRSYRRRTGAAAPPVRFVGLGKARRPPHAA